ncbi:MAG: hypothetical protein ACRELB_06205, partial [Polyangiaceae bacterium]
SYPASTPDPPIVQNAGGAIVSTPRFVPVFFSGEAMASPLTDAMTKYVASSAWHDAVAEYGVGAGAVATPVQVTTALPSSTMTSDDLGAWLGGQLYDGSSTIDWGPVDAATIASTVFVLFPPASVTVVAPGYDGTSASDPTLCGSRPWDLTGWHWQTAPALGRTAPVVFAVVGHCSYDQTPVIDRMTATLSHELAEAATDPTPVTLPAYSALDDAHAYWMYFTGGGEVGDLCGQDASQLLAPPDVGYMVQRIWSNAAASAGHDPCVPAAGPAYFDVNADMPDRFYEPYVGAYVHGVSIAPGASRTIDVRLLSDAPTDPWKLTAVDPNEAAGGSRVLDLSLDVATGQNGDVRHLTIQPLFAGHGDTALYEIDSTLHGVTHCWYGEIAIE